MLHLINGRGQLGTILSSVSSQITEEIYLYHTWSVSNKEKECQYNEYLKFQSFVDENKDKKIGFISTTSQKDTWYTHYKHLAEALLLTKCEKGFVIRLPTFIGQPCKLFADDVNVEAKGKVELISIETAGHEILDICKKDTKVKITNVPGELVSAQLVIDILKVKI